MDARRGPMLWRIFAITVVGVALAGCADDEKRLPAVSMDPGEDVSTAEVAIDPASTAYVDGSIVYRQRIAIPRGSTVVVEMLELAPSTRPVAHQQFPVERQVPIPFQLAYDKGRVDPARSYGLRARILVDGALWFINEQPEPVLTRGNPSSVQIVVAPASARSGD